MAHLDMPKLIEKLELDLPLSQLERVFLREICERMFTTTELDHLTERKTLQ